MKFHLRTFSVSALTLAASVAIGPRAHAGTDPLPAWNEGSAKHGILTFVQEFTDKLNPDFVPRGERIVTFDSNGTL